jgi:trans-2,3-dihydro-3-hydroxyanthranilate isomerase
MPQPNSYRYLVVDVFTRVPLEGNALAVFPDSRGLDTATMQRIARELNLSETVFVRPSERPDCAARLRIFTPAREMQFAGHPTVGTGYILLAEGVVPDGVTRFSVEENVGPVAIDVEAGNPPRIWLTTPPIEFRDAFDAAACAHALGIGPGDLLPATPQIVDAGNPTLFVAVRSKEVVDRCWLDGNAFSQLKPHFDTPFCVFVFAPTSEGAYSRMFAPEYGIVEDPATGSSTGPLAAFMRRHDLLPNSGATRLVSEQGTKMGRRSLLYFDVSSIDTRAGIPVGGYVTPVATGVLTL